MKVFPAFLLACFLPAALAAEHWAFNRISFFPVCRQLDPSCRNDTVTNSEIVSASKDGMTLVYGDSERGFLGFVDIRDPYHPTPLGTVDVGGEPTSVGVIRDYAIVAVNTSPDFVNVSGLLHVIHIPTQTVERTMELEGQPDSVATSPDERYVVIAIENERDEDLGEGGLPQLPTGFLYVLMTEPEDLMQWELSPLFLADLPGVIEPDDVEPEFVAISTSNIAVVTLQENNGLVLVDLENMEVTSSFPAGTVTLTNIDVNEDGMIFQNASAVLKDLPREPDGVVWISPDMFVTADEGDWNGGTRGFTIFDTGGNVVYTSGNEMETIATLYGHYPDHRADAKGMSFAVIKLLLFSLIFLFS